MISFKAILFTVLLSSALVVIAQGKKSLSAGFTVWIWMFIIGYRTLHLTSKLAIHPLIFFLAFLFVLFLFMTRNEKNAKARLPGWVWAFSVFWIWGFFPGGLNGFSWERMISDALNFFFLIPLFWIILYLSRSPDFWKKAIVNFLGSGALISLLGSLEYYSPGFRSLVANLPGFAQANIEGIRSSMGFLRAGFAFFGANPAALICALALPMAIAVPKFYKSGGARLFSAGVAALLILGIYISGARVAWIMLFVASVLFSYFTFGAGGVFLIGAFWAGVSSLFSEQVWKLILSVYTPITTGRFLDSSMEKRYFRQQDAFDLALQNPLGLGWTGSGWVHGDFTQVAANLGLVAGMIFVLWYLSTLYRAWRAHRKSPQDRLGQAVFIAFVMAGIVLATEGVQVLSQFVMPVWFIWGLTEAYIQKSNAAEISPDTQPARRKAPRRFGSAPSFRR